MAGSLIIADAFPALGKDGRYHPHLAELRDYQASGVYAIVSPRGLVLYVGESHSGRLYDTITRHFRAWKVDRFTDAQGRRFGGTTYDRNKVRVIYLVCNAGEAQERQYAEIQRLQPRDNINDGSSTAVELPV